MQPGLLITGSYGQLGKAMLDEARSRGIPVDGRDVDTLDITDHRAIDAWVTAALPGAVINCAAYTAVDDCETHEDDARAVNAGAVEHLATACNRVGATLVQISTDYVFDGSGSRPYREDDPVAPRTAYGRTKLLGEQAAKAAEDHLIVRTAWLYGHGGRHFVGAIAGQIESGNQQLRVVADQIGSPTLSDDLAAAVLDLVSVDARGTIHAVNSGRTSWHGFAVEIARLLKAEVEILPVTTDEFPRPAPRPGYSVLDTGRLESLLGRRMPDWRYALARYFEAS